MVSSPEGLQIIRDVPQGIIPRMRLTFHGGQHDPFNVQGVAGFQDVLDFHLQGAPGKTTVLLEDSALTPGDAKKLSRIFKADGFVNTAQSEWLYQQLGKPPSYVDILRRRKELAELDLKTDLQVAIDRGLVNPEKLRDYFVMQALEANKKRIDVESESHPTDRLKQIRASQVQYHHHADRFYDLWYEGEPDQSIEQYKLCRDSVDRASEIRDEDILVYLQVKANFFRDYPKGGSLVLAFGPAHEGLAVRVAELINQDLPLQVYSKTDQAAESPILDLARNRSKGLDDLIYAQAIILTVFYNVVGKRMADEHNLAVYAQNYEGIFGLLTEVARSLSLTEIKSLCANREDPIAFLESNQIGNQLFNYEDKTIE